MSQLVLRESSNLDETSSDTEHSDWQKDNMDYATMLFQSEDKIDQRFIDLYRVRRARQLGIKVGIDDNMESMKTYREKKSRRVGNFTNLLKDSIHIPLQS